MSSIEDRARLFKERRSQNQQSTPSNSNITSSTNLTRPPGIPPTNNNQSQWTSLPIPSTSNSQPQQQQQTTSNWDTNNTTPIQNSNSTQNHQSSSNSSQTGVLNNDLTSADEKMRLAQEAHARKKILLEQQARERQTSLAKAGIQPTRYVDPSTTNSARAFVTGGNAGYRPIAVAVAPAPTRTPISTPTPPQAQVQSMQIRGSAASSIQQQKFLAEKARSTSGVEIVSAAEQARQALALQKSQAREKEENDRIRLQAQQASQIQQAQYQAQQAQLKSQQQALENSKAKAEKERRDQESNLAQARIDQYQSTLSQLTTLQKEKESEFNRRKELESKLLESRRENQSLDLDLDRFKTKIQAMEQEDRNKNFRLQELEKIREDLRIEVKEWEEAALSNEKLGVQSIEESKPITFEVFKEVGEAYDFFKISSSAGDQQILDHYRLLLSSNPSLSKSYHGAIYIISITRSTPLFATILHKLLQNELAAYLSSLSPPLPLHPALRMFLDDFATYTFTNTLATASLSDSLILNGNRTAVEEELKKEKLRSSKLDTRLSSLHLELENKVKELTSWRLKAEKAEKSLSEIPTRKSTILQADLESLSTLQKSTENKLTEMTKRYEKSEKESKKLKERLDETEVSFRKSEKELAASIAESKALVPLPSPSPSLAVAVQQEPSPEVSKALATNKFIIAKLAASVKQFSADLAAEKAENAELLLKLASIGRSDENDGEYESH